MPRTLILDTKNKVGETVEICGFIEGRRDHGKIGFLDVSDRSGLIQVFCTGELLGDLRTQDVVCIRGKVAKRPEKLVNEKLPTGSIELQAEKIEILSKAEELPFDMGVKELELQLPTLLDYRTLTLRHPKIKAVFKVQAALAEGFRKVAKEIGCVEIFVPTIAASSTEGGAEVFKIDYYGHRAFMSQSPQLYKQMLVPVFERVFTISKAYRAEPSVTTRHLSESTQMDIELGFTDFEELLDTLEGVAVFMLRHTEDVCRDIFEEFELRPIAYGKVPRLSLREAQEIIFKEFGRDNRAEKDLAPQDEIDICKWALEKHNSDFVTITKFPLSAKPFYTMPDPEDGEYSLSYDLLFRGVEILSGSQRQHDFGKLVDAIKARGMDPEGFEMYLQAFKFGMPPEGGFSFGLERVTMHVLGLKNVREASLFPRDMERVDLRFSENSNLKTQN